MTRTRRSPNLGRAAYGSGVRRVLVTGMSGVGKSTVLAALESRGFDVVDTDEPGWTDWSDAQQGYVWREPRIVELLGGDRDVALFVSGTVSNQGRFYSSFDAVVLLSAPVHVLLGRIDARTTNDYGKTAEQRELILPHGHRFPAYAGVVLKSVVGRVV